MRNSPALQRFRTILPLRSRPGGMALALATAPPEALLSLVVAAGKAAHRRRASLLLAASTNPSPMTGALLGAIVTAGGKHIHEVVDNLSAATPARARALACAIAATAPDARTLGALALPCRDDDRSVRRAAASAVRALSARASRRTPWWEAWDAFLADAAREYPDHRLSAVLGALLRVAIRPGPRVHALLHAAPDAAHFALRGALRRSHEPGARGAALALLSCDALAPAAIERLRAPDDLAEHDLALRGWRMLVHPVRRRRVRLLDLRALPDAETWPLLSEQARRGVVAWLGALRVPREERTRLLLALAGDPCLDVSVSAERALARAQRPERPAPVVTKPTRVPATIALAREIARARLAPAAA